MTRAIYCWSGLAMVAFFGFFAIWVHRSYDRPTGSGLFWLCLGGVSIGVALVHVSVIATAMVVAIRETTAGRE